jgi:hypothetical protein
MFYQQASVCGALQEEWDTSFEKGVVLKYVLFLHLFWGAEEKY